MAEGDDEKKVNLNIDSKDFRGPGHLFPLNPAAPAFKTKFPVKVDTKGYTAPERVDVLAPEVQ